TATSDEDNPYTDEAYRAGEVLICTDCAMHVHRKYAKTKCEHGNAPLDGEEELVCELPYGHNGEHRMTPFVESEWYKQHQENERVLRRRLANQRKGDRRRRRR